MFFMYWFYLLFSLKTNQFEFDSVPHPAEVRGSKPDSLQHDSDDEAEMSSLLSPRKAEEEEKEEGAVLSYHLALKWLLFVTAVVGFLSDVLVGTIEAFTER